MMSFKISILFVKDGKSITLIPLLPKNIYEDQLKLKKKKSKVKGSENLES
jgi:hypothetical protein